MDRFRMFLPVSQFALTLSLIGALGLGSLGCNTGTEEPAAPKADPASQSTGSANTTGGADATPTAKIDPSRFPELAEGVEAAVPSNYPSDLPVYPGSVPAQGRGTSGEDGEMAAVQLLTNDPPAQAFGYYRENLEAKGWAIGRIEEGESPVISVTKDGCKAVVMFVPSSSGTGTDIFTISSCDDA